MHENSEELCAISYMHNGQRITYSADNHTYVHQQSNDVLEIGIQNPKLIPTVPYETPSAAIHSDTLTSTIQSETLTSAKIYQVYYSRDIDRLELKELLDSWNVVELFEYFESKFIK